MSVPCASNVVLQVHEMTKRREYQGPVMDLAKAVSECPSGGQIICCQGTFAGILDQQARILQTVPEHADHDVLYDMLRSALQTPLQRPRQHLQPFTSLNTKSSHPVISACE